MTAKVIAGPRTRIHSIDILRGIVMLIMAIDHIRDHMMIGHPDPTDLATTTPVLFFTRWITHFCAPVFVFLSGISAYLAGNRRTQKELSVFLIKRGIWLVVVELLLIGPAIRLSWDYQGFGLQVIWAIGGSMIILGILVGSRAPVKLIGFLGLLIVFGRNILDSLHMSAIDDTVIGKLLLSSTGSNRKDLIMLPGGQFVMIVYALLPWTGIMLIGYFMGNLYRPGSDKPYRKKFLLYAGLGSLLLFIALRSWNIYGDPMPWTVQRSTPLTVISVLNVTKYPCSLLYCCLTLGIAMIALAFMESWNNRLTAVFRVYGNVPFFYYVCHWYLLQLIHVIAFFALGFNTSQIVDPHLPFRFTPPGFGFSLPGIYVIWLIVIFVLYWPCRWFGRYKQTHSHWWLSYL